MGSSPSRPPPGRTMQRPSDEAILKYEEEIREQEVMSIPLVSDQMPLECLLPEYEHAPGFTSSLVQLMSTGKMLRRMRGDGSCFYRAVGFHLTEQLLSNPGVLCTLMTRIKDLMTAVGFEAEGVYGDFLEEFEAIVREGEGQDGDWLASEWRKQEWRSNAVVVVLRMLCSAYLRSHAEEYEAFVSHLVPSGGNVMEVFCQRHVECVGQEADQIHVIALAKALGVTMLISQMEDGHELQLLEFTADHPSDLNAVHLLYRPGHYDLLY